MTKPISIHYAGEVWTENGGHLGGWAACCSGEKAVAIRARGNHTYHASEVTCKVCLKQIARHRAYTAKIGRGPKIQP